MINCTCGHIFDFSQGLVRRWLTCRPNLRASKYGSGLLLPRKEKLVCIFPCIRPCLGNEAEDIPPVVKSCHSSGAHSTPIPTDLQPRAATVPGLYPHIHHLISVCTDLHHCTQPTVSVLELSSAVVSQNQPLSVRRSENQTTSVPSLSHRFHLRTPVPTRKPLPTGAYDQEQTGQEPEAGYRERSAVGRGLRVGQRARYHQNAQQRYRERPVHFDHQV